MGSDPMLPNSNRLLEWFADWPELFSTVSQCETPQAKKDLSGYERVAACCVAVVRNDAKHLTQRIQCEFANRRTAGKRSGLFQLQGEIHRVETAVQHLEAPVALIGCVECC